MVVDYFDSNSDSTFPERFGCKGEYKSTIVDKSNLESVSLQNNQLLQFDPSVEINDITSLYDKLVGSRVLLLLTSIDYKDIEQSENLSTASLLYTPANNSKLFFGRNKLFSSGIYSGLVVSFVFIVILVVALNCLLGLQTPTRFAKPPKDKKL